MAARPRVSPPPPASRRVVQVLTVPESLRFMRGVGAVLRARGWDGHFVTSPGAMLDEFGEREGVSVHPVPMPRAITPLGDAGALVQLVRLLRGLRPDLVHAQTPKGGLLGCIAAGMTGNRALYHMRGLPFMGLSGVRRPLLWGSERVSCGLADEVVCQSQSLMETARASRLLSSSEGRVLGAGGNGVDLGRFDAARVEEWRGAVRGDLGISETAPCFGFVGRLVGDKGVAELLSSYRTLGSREPAPHLLVVGPFEERDAVSSEVRAAFDAEPRIHWVGEREDVERYYAAMDFLVLPSYREGFPNVPLEAAAMGRATVATRVPGCVDAVVDGQTGLLVESRSAVELTAAIAAYLDDPALARAHGEAARQRVRADFSRSVRFEQLVNLYDEVAER